MKLKELQLRSHAHAELTWLNKRTLMCCSSGAWLPNSKMHCTALLPDLDRFDHNNIVPLFAFWARHGARLLCAGVQGIWECFWRPIAARKLITWARTFLLASYLRSHFVGECSPFIAFQSAEECAVILLSY